MEDRTTFALLRATLAFLNATPDAVLGQEAIQSRVALAAIIDAHLSDAGLIEPAQDIIDIARRRWGAEGRVRIDATPAVRLAHDGIWVSAWLSCGEKIVAGETLQGERLQSAIAALPIMTREVFILHRIEGLDIPDIANRLALRPSAVRRHFANALIGMLEPAPGERKA